MKWPRLPRRVRRVLLIAFGAAVVLSLAGALYQAWMAQIRSKR